MTRLSVSTATKRDVYKKTNAGLLLATNLRCWVFCLAGFLPAIQLDNSIVQSTSRIACLVRSRRHRRRHGHRGHRGRLDHHGLHRRAGHLQVLVVLHSQ